MSSPPPKHSLSSPTSGGSPSPVLPTPSSSSSASEVTNQLRRELEQQIAEKEKQLQDSSSGIGKSVLARQISQLKERLQEVDKRQPVSQNPIRRSQSPAEEDLSPATLEKLRNLERDLSAYRGYQQLSPSLSSSRKDKLLGQRSSGLDPLPSPSTSTMLPPAHGRDSPSSLLPLPPPPTGSTPTKRRSKVPNADRRNTDIEFATEIGQGLLLEVRKMQALLQEKEDQLKQLEAQKADLERAAESMAKQLRQKEENEEKLKEETWNLELAKQELTTTVTELQQNLSRSNAEQKRMQDHMDELTAEIEHMRDREERLATTVEAMKQKHEHDMANLRRHSAGLQREKADYAKQVEALSSELAIAKAQSKIAKKSQSDLRPAAAVEPREEQAQSTAGPSKEGSTPGTTPPPSPKQTPSRNQALEVETLKSSLAHAHRMVSNLRSNLHKEKTEKFELKKLLSEYQETIEQLQNDPRLWVDTGYPKSGSGGGSSQDANGGSGAHKRHRKGKRRVPVSKTSVARYSKGVESLDDSSDAENGRKRKDSQLASYYSSEGSEYEEDDDVEDMPNADSSHQFESLSSELSKCQQKQVAETVEAPRTLGDELSAAFSSSPENAAIVGAGAAGLAAGSMLESSRPTGVDISTQTEDVTPPQISTQEMAIQTDDVKKNEFSQVQMTAVDIAPVLGHDAEAQCTPVATVDAAIQSEQLPGVNQHVQSESATFIDSSVQCEPAQTLDQGVQSSIESVSTSVQSDPPAVPETIDASAQYDLVQPGKDAEVQVAIESPASAATAVVADAPRRESTSSDHAAAIATGAGAFGLGALAARAFGRFSGAKPAEPAGSEKDRSVKQDATDQPVTPLESEQVASAQDKIASKQPAADTNGLGEIDQVAPVKEQDASSSPSQVTAKDTTKLQEEQGATSPVPTADKDAVASKSPSGAPEEISTPVPSSSKAMATDADEKVSPAHSEQGEQDAKVYSKEETDAMIVAAVAEALAKAKAADKNDAAEKNVTQQQNGEAAHKSTLSDLAARGSSEDLPSRPVSPPPAHLLSRVGQAPSNRSSMNSTSTVDKGKVPVRVLRNAPPPPANDDRAPSLLSSVSASEARASFGSSAYDSSMRNQGDVEAGPIALVTQTMIGDWMWKYTRNAVGNGLSDHRHRRFFWVHPYTRTLYWSPRAPGNPKNQTKTKSALIEGVSVVPDNNSAPAPDVPNVSLLIKTNDRVIKLTAPNMARHNVWLESLSYLLARGNNDGKSIGLDTASSAATQSLSHRASFQGLQHYFWSSSKQSEQPQTSVRDEDSEDEALEDVRMCCDGKHHLSKLERDHIHHHRPYYRKRQSRQAVKG